MSSSNKIGGKMNMFCQFLRLMKYFVVFFLVLIFAPIILFCILVWYLWINAKYAFGRERLTFAFTDKITRFVLRKKTTNFALYVGWLIQNRVLCGLVKTLKKRGSNYERAKVLFDKVTSLVADIKQFRKMKVDVGEEFDPVSYEKFAKRDRRYFYSQHGAVIVPEMSRCGDFILSLTTDDEIVISAIAVQLVSFIRFVPYVHQRKWFGRLQVKANDCVKDLAIEIRKKLSEGYHAYADNMIRRAKELGDIEVMEEWLISENLLKETLSIATIPENEVAIKSKWQSFVDKVNKAGQRMFLDMVRVEGFKLPQKDYIDVECDDGVGNSEHNASETQFITIARDTVFVEGRTDEKYFKSAMETFDLNFAFEYKWIGHIGSNGQEEFSGDGSLKTAEGFLRGHDFGVRIVLQYDCDRPHKTNIHGSVAVRSVNQYKSSKGCDKGTENALILDCIETKKWDGFFVEKETKNSFGKPGKTYELKKMELCNYICSLSKAERRKIFRNLKTEIEEASKVFGKIKRP